MNHYKYIYKHMHAGEKKMDITNISDIKNNWQHQS